MANGFPKRMARRDGNQTSHVKGLPGAADCGMLA